MPITTKIVSSNPNLAMCTRYNHFVIKFVSDLRQGNGFLHVLRFPPPIKLKAMSIWSIVESGAKHHNLDPLNLDRQINSSDP